MSAPQTPATDTSPVSDDAARMETEPTSGGGSEETTKEQISNDPWQNTSCVFCQREFTDAIRPKLLPCLHNSCSDCIAPDCDVLTCSVCQELCPTNEIIDNYFFPVASGEGTSGNSEGKEEQQAVCTSCEENAVAESYCGDCGEWLCDACVKAHLRVRVTKDHVIRPRNEIAGTMRRTLFCPTHRQELLKLFCQTCDRLTCRDCQLSDHRDHRYQFASEASARERKVFEAMLAVIDDKKGILESCKNLSEMRQADILRCEKAIEEDIRGFVAKYVQEINQRGQEHLKHLRNICQGLRSELTQSHSAITDCLGRINHAMKFVHAAMQHDNDPAIILHSKRIIIKQLGHIHKSQVNVPNPDLAMEFRFLDDARFVNVLRQLGEVSVKVQQPTMKQLDGPGKAEANSPHGTKRPHPSSTSPHPTRAHQAPSPSSQVSSTSSALTGMTKVLEKMLTSKEALPPLPPMPPPALPAYHDAIQHRSHQPNPEFSPVSGANVSGSTAIRNQLLHQILKVPNPGDPMNRPIMPQQAPVQSQRIGSLTLTPIVSEHQMTPSHHQGNWGYSQVAALQQRQSFPMAQPQLQIHMQQQMKLLQRQHLQQQQYQQQQQQQQHQQFQQQQQQQHQQQQQQQQLRHNMQLHQQQRQQQQPGHQMQFLSGGGVCARRPAADMVSINIVSKDCQQKAAESKEGERRIVVQPGMKTQTGTPAADGAAPNKSLNEFCQNALTCVLASIDKSMENGIMVPAAQSSNKPREDGGSRASPAQCSGLGLLQAEVANLDRLKTERPDTGFQACAGNASNGNLNLLTERCPILLSTLQSAGDCRYRLENKQSWYPPFRTQQGETSRQNSGDAQQKAENPGLSSQASESDPNEDWCAVCHDGGDLLCCGKCPRVYHLQCHVPSLSSSTKEEDNWQCLMCRNYEELSSPCDSAGKRKFMATIGNVSIKLCERILLELFCHETSTPFHEPVSRAVPDYYKLIEKPMDLSMVKRKLHPQNLNHYSSTKEFAQDIRLIFKNCFTFNPKDSVIYTNGKILEEFFDDLLQKYIPEHAYDIAPTPATPNSQEMPERHHKKRKQYSHPFIHIR